MSINRVFFKLVRLRPYDLYIFIEASFFLALASIVRVTIPLRWYAPFFGRHMEVSPERIKHKEHNSRTYTIFVAIKRGSRYLPMECKCLVQAMASKAMLRLRRIRSTVYLGVAKDEENSLIAHAWVRSGEMYVTGGNGERKYKVISTFADGNCTVLSGTCNDTTNGKGYIGVNSIS